MLKLQNVVRKVVGDSEAASKIKDEYCAKTPASAQLYARARRTQPGGVSRNVCHWSPHPLTMDRGDGACIWDIDGNRYIDLLGNFTALVHGNCYGPVQAVTEREIPRGAVWAANNRAQVSLAEQIVDRVAGVDQVRFTNTGTEAGNLALLIARGLTGRHKIVMARFGYHGALHEFEAGSFNLGGPDTYLATYGDIDSFRNILDENGDEIAAIFVEGVLGAGGMQPAPPEFFRELKIAANRAGALLVIDEVISFRLGFGGQQGNMGVTSDLTMLGKLIGGGFPIGAVGGPEHLMRSLDMDNIKVWHSGTFNANPISMAAGDVAVRELTDERIQRMNELGVRLTNGLLASAAKLGLPFSVNHIGSLLNIFFVDEPPADITQRTDYAAVTKFHLACLNNGLLIAGRGMFALSTIMDEALIDESVERAAAAMAAVAEEL